MKRRNVAKGFLGSTAKQIACLAIASSVLMSPLAAYAETASIDGSQADQKMAPVSTVSEREVLNILVPSQPTSLDPEQIAPPTAVYTDISGKPEGAAQDAQSTAETTKDKTVKDAPKSGGRMARLRKMASRVRYSREKKAIATADLGALAESKKADSDETAKTADAKTPAAETTELKPEEGSKSTSQTASPVSQSLSDPTQSKSQATESEAVPAAAQAEAGTASPEIADNYASANSDASTSAPVADATEVIEESKDKDGAAIAFGLPGTLSDLENASKLSADGIIVVDNDEAVEQNDHLQYEEMPLDEGKTKVKIGARFPVVISSALNSKTNKKGDRLEARLKYDLKIGDKLIAKKGSVVRGHINYCLKARTILHSLWSPERWYRNSGCIGIDFDEIINEKGEHIPCAAAPAQAGRVIKNKGEGRELGVNHNGQVVGPWAQQLRYKAVRVGLNFAMAPAGVFSFGAMPVALGVIGAANPNFAFGRPVGLNVRHRRIKGFLWGALSGVPGSWLIEDTTVKGQEAIIRPGDEFYAAFKQEFNGEPETDASIMAGASAKVRGQVIKEPAAKKKK
ncbi:MAG: hypothetical protein IT342_03630 [Candidatus Melainabacteria bacterium]|nr:hypothetical protein [Candidatus Melainabacteria bacterium]